jgi:ribosome-binding factor A
MVKPKSRVSTIKHAQKESVLLHTIAQLFMQIMQDEPLLKGLTVTRAVLSPNKSSCTIFFHTLGGLKEFEEKRKTLVLYKPSLRQALAKSIHGRYTPDLRFAYDQQLDKQRRIDDLIDKLKDEGKL